MNRTTNAAPAELAEHMAAREQHRVLGEMLARSATDREFRALMLRDARAAFAQFGADVPASMDIVFIENEHDMTIVLPDAIDELVELDENELLALNGGSSGQLSPLTPASQAITTSSSFCISATLATLVVTVAITIAQE
jgi:hypothetical protein